MRGSTWRRLTDSVEKGVNTKIWQLRMTSPGSKFSKEGGRRKEEEGNTASVCT